MNGLMTFLTGSNNVTSADFKSVLDAITQQINVQTIVEVLVVGVGAAVGLVFMWWGVRWLIQQLMKSARNGKM